jgi:hypothetical protein
VAATYRRCAVGNSRSSKWLCPASKKRKSRNFDAFLKKRSSAEKNNKKRDYADFAYALITKILNLVPTDMLDNLAFKIDDNGNKTNINFQNYV